MTTSRLPALPLLLLLIVSPVFAQTALPASQPPQNSEKEVVTLPTFDVTASKPVGYGTTTALGATRMNVPIVDTSHSVIIINRELMDDMGTLDDLDVLKFVSGVNPASTRTTNVISLRGEEASFRDTSTRFVDGLPGGRFSEMETEFLDRIEVIKGPVGTLYGSHSLGGIVNRTMKRPLPFAQTVVKGTFDTTGSSYQASVDTTAPLGDSGFAYRLIGVIRDGEADNGSVDNKEAIYGYVSWTPKDTSTRLWVRYYNQHIETGHEAFDTFFDGDGNPSPFDTDTILTPARPKAVRYFDSYEAGFESQVRQGSTAWNFRLVARYDTQDFYEDAIVPLGFRFLDSNGGLIGATGTAANPSQPKFDDPRIADIRIGGTSTRRAGDPDGQGDRQWGVFFDIVGDFDTGPLKHKSLVYAQISGQRSVVGLIGFDLVPAAKEFSLFNPDVRSFSSITTNPRITQDQLSTSNAFNMGIQDSISLFNNRLILVGGARYDYLQDDGTVNRRAGTRANRRTSTSWVAKAGVVAKPIPGNDKVSLFYNYSETFSPVPGTNLAGVPFTDTQGTANEVGVKLELLKQGLIATASYFDNENTNFPIRVFNPNLGLDDFVQEGTGTADGWEADIAWQPNDNVSFLVALSDVDSRNPSGLRKRTIQNKFNSRIVGKYNFTSGALNGFTAGAAFVQISSRAGDNPNSFFLQGYETVDLFFFYGRDKWKAQLNISNLFDDDGVESSIISSIAQRLRPLGARFSLQYTF